MIVFFTLCKSYQSGIVLEVFFIIIFFTQLGRIIVKRPRTIIWMGRYIINKLLLLLRISFLVYYVYVALPIGGYSC